MIIDDLGWAGDARRVVSPNCDERPSNAGIDLLVIHNISLPPGEFGGPAVEQLFTNRLDPDAHPYFAGIHTLRVSSHFFIRRDGELIQFVPCCQRAWHAGIVNLAVDGALQRLFHRHRTGRQRR
jgi:N-acetyl-anhydromuramoyl-L-alanine amidase